MMARHTLESTWQAVATTALLGTDRQPFSAPLATGVLATLLGQLDYTQPERAVLDTAALLALYRRAGCRPTRRTWPTSRASVADLPRCSPQATAHLMALLDGVHSALLPEWLALAANLGLRVAEEALPPLLEHGAQQPPRRTAIRQVIGARGRWLATFNPAWGYATGTRHTLDDEWQIALPDARLALLHDLRQSDPAHALALLTTTWATEPPDLRARFLKTLATNLSLADEPFLESTLDDRRKEVRDEAAQLLAHLPTSRLVQRMIDRTTPLLRMAGLWRKTVEVSLPAAHTPAMQRDGIHPTPTRSYEKMGPRAWWLYQMLAVVPTAHWGAHLQLPPQRLVEAAARSEWQELLLDAWLEAARRHAETEFLVALSEQTCDKNPARLARIAEALPTHALEDQILRMLARPHAQFRGGDPDLTLLAAHRRPWGAELSNRFVARLKSIIQQQTFRPADHADLCALLPQCALFLAPAAVQTFENGLASDRSDWPDWARSINPFLTIVQFRASMHTALAESILAESITQ